MTAISLGCLLQAQISPEAKAQSEADARKSSLEASSQTRVLLIQQFDTNQNGRLEPDEKRALQTAIRKKVDKGTLRTNLQARPQKPEDFDVNGDGVLSPEEKEQMAKAAALKKAGQNGGFDRSAEQDKSRKKHPSGFSPGN